MSSAGVRLLPPLTLVCGSCCPGYPKRAAPAALGRVGGARCTAVTLLAQIFSWTALCTLRPLLRRTFLCLLVHKYALQTGHYTCGSLWYACAFACFCCVFALFCVLYFCLSVDTCRSRRPPRSLVSSPLWVLCIR